ncbi:MAG: hypothetical protein ACXVCM_14245 [Ktedonobacteraceae bacterium]
MSGTSERPPEDRTGESTQAFSEQHIRLLYRQKRAERRFKVITAIMLSIVAVTTAWSGYQAARWCAVHQVCSSERSSGCFNP